MLSLNALRRSLAKPSTSVQLAVIGVLAGMGSATVIILFRLLIANFQLSFFGHFDNFTAVEAHFRFILPFIAIAVILIVGYGGTRRDFLVGIPFSIHWIKVKKGAMPLRNAINQFVGGAVALISGFSVGREGPSVHIGATMASYVGAGLKLPYNAVRTLTGCGIAAGIAASFNTPLAAVVFVMEVVFREYKIHIFIPIMLAAVVGTLMTRAVFGNEHELSFFSATDFTMLNYPYLLVCAVVISAVAYTFNASLMKTLKVFKPVKIYYRLTLAALLTAIIGYMVPQALGSGMGAIQFATSDLKNYETLSALGFIIPIVAAKFIATVVALGLGIPGGVIGPILGIGVLLGTTFGLISQTVGITGDQVALYAVLSMAGLMAATLHSPLAALVALLELTANPELIAPAMLVIAVSYTISVQVFGNRSIFIQQLDHLNLPYRLSPAAQTLQKAGVLSELSTDYILLEDVEEAHIRQKLATTSASTSIVLKDLDIFDCQYKLAQFADPVIERDHSLAISSSDIQYINLQGISAQSTLAEAFDLLQHKQQGAVFIYQDKVENIIGLLHWQQLRQLLVERNNFT